MKIGILTLPLRHNYGGILQAYALQSCLKQRGHDPYIIRLKPYNPPLKMIAKSQLKNAIYSLVGREVSSMVLSGSQLDKEVYSEMNRFIDVELSPLTGFASTNNNLVQLDNEYRFDAYVVGSDQVWRAEYAQRYLPYMFLSHLKRDVVRVAYAASFGTSEWNASYSETDAFAKLLQRFDLVTVRESTGIEICKNNFGVDAKLAIDPTLLLKVDDYQSLHREGGGENANGIFEYILDRSSAKQSIKDELCNTLRNISYNVDSFPVHSMANIDEKKMKSPYAWLKAFDTASFVMTDSFHGCVFSLIHNKPFAVYANQKRGFDRFYTLLNRFNLLDRVVDEQSNINNIVDKTIDWVHVNQEIVKAQFESSLLFKRVSL